MARMRRENIVEVFLDRVEFVTAFDDTGEWCPQRVLFILDEIHGDAGGVEFLLVRSFPADPGKQVGAGHIEDVRVVGVEHVLR